MADVSGLKNLKYVVPREMSAAELKKIALLSQLGVEAPSLYGRVRWTRVCTPQLGTVELSQAALIEELGTVLTLTVVASMPRAPFTAVRIGHPKITAAVQASGDYGADYEFASFGLKHYADLGYAIELHAGLADQLEQFKLVDINDPHTNAHKVELVSWGFN
ncbi:hypothetical protein HII28_17970 [Planctomonas sp. JC2975]|uniref:hypothetical protein n=1 Tax=Planctomonas sp. JC2975 TaxID=2729626 RepID=UPI00147428A0|nr:hypothetical protein [Planctomonas sp. JC2975]NNC13756.1 hypothetical protein [Planctomonas sp. JC2975]